MTWHYAASVATLVFKAAQDTINTDNIKEATVRPAAALR